MDTWGFESLIPGQFYPHVAWVVFETIHSSGLKTRVQILPWGPAFPVTTLGRALAQCRLCEQPRNSPFDSEHREIQFNMPGWISEMAQAKYSRYFILCGFESLPWYQFMPLYANWKCGDAKNIVVGDSNSFSGTNLICLCTLTGSANILRRCWLWIRIPPGAPI